MMTTKTRGSRRRREYDVVLLTQEEARKVAEVCTWYSSACMDMAYSAASHDCGFEDERAALKKKGVRDIGGALADEFFNDVEMARDLIADRVHDALGWDRAKDKKIWAEAAALVQSQLRHLTGLQEALTNI